MQKSVPFRFIILCVLDIFTGTRFGTQLLTIELSEKFSYERVVANEKKKQLSHKKFCLKMSRSKVMLQNRLGGWVLLIDEGVVVYK